MLRTTAPGLAVRILRKEPYAAYSLFDGMFDGILNHQNSCAGLRELKG